MFSVSLDQSILTGSVCFCNVCILAGISAFEVGIDGFCEGSCNWQSVLGPHGEGTGPSRASLKNTFQKTNPIKHRVYIEIMYFLSDFILLNKKFKHRLNESVRSRMTLASRWEIHRMGSNTLVKSAGKKQERAGDFSPCTDGTTDTQWLNSPSKAK